MAILETSLRRQLENVIAAARAAAETATHHALTRLGLPNDAIPAGLSDEERLLRKRLLALRKLVGSYETLKEQCAFEQWHRLLFARYLAENELLIYPRAGVPVTLEECADPGLQEEYGAQDAWQLASHYAAEMLPALFRPNDPLLRVRFSPEDQSLLEAQLQSLSPEVFTADDSLGWTYQYWQRDRKAAVNKAAKPIGGSDLSAVTQLFTEHYMVRFLLENTLGAWWQHHHPASTLVAGWEYYKPDIPHDHTPLPTRLEEITFMDPCCGSGHFLVEAFHLVRSMYEEQGFSAAAAGDAALRNNVHGLELDPRCAQIATFNLALQAWRTGGFRPLPEIQVACVGVPLQENGDQWTKLAGSSNRLRAGMKLLTEILSKADHLGSLIHPAQAFQLEQDGRATQLTLAGIGAASTERPRAIGVRWEELEPLLITATKEPNDDDPERSIAGVQALDAIHAVRMLSREYWFAATNPPFLLAAKAVESLREFCTKTFSDAKKDLATCFVLRLRAFTAKGGEYALVSPQNWLFLGSDKAFRTALLKEQTWIAVVRFGPRAFETVSGEVMQAANLIFSNRGPHFATQFYGLDAAEPRSAREKAALLRCATVGTQLVEAGDETR